MKFKNAKSFLGGAFVTLLVFTMIVSVSAKVGTVSKELEYQDVKVSLDGTNLDLTDANGNEVEPFMLDGTNYLPVRALAETLGLEVGWDGATNTVVLTTPTKQSTPSGTVLVDEKGIKISYINATEDTEDDYPDDYRAFHLNFCVENNSNKDIYVTLDDVSLNDIMEESLFGCPVPAGKKTYDSADFLEKDIQKDGIYTIKSAEITFNIFDPETFESGLITEPITIDVAK